MAASYPGAIKTFSAVVNGVTKLVAALFNSPYDEVTAVETELGTDVAGSATDLKTRLAVAMSDAGIIKVSAGGTGATLLQRGSVTGVTPDTETTVTFGTAFANTSYTVIITALMNGGGAGYTAHIGVKSADKFTFYTENGATAIEWLALGNA